MCEKLLEKLTFSLLLSQPLTKFPLNETYIQQKCDDFFLFYILMVFYRG